MLPPCNLQHLAGSPERSVHLRTGIAGPQISDICMTGIAKAHGQNKPGWTRLPPAQESCLEFLGHTPIHHPVINPAPAPTNWTPSCPYFVGSSPEGYDSLTKMQAIVGPLVCVLLLEPSHNSHINLRANMCMVI